MKNKLLKIFAFSIALVFAVNVNSFAAILDPTIPTFDPNFLSLESGGTASFVAPTYSGIWKRYDVQLLKRVTTVNTTGGVTYTYKTHGSIKHADVTDTSIDFSISSTGYYQFQIRGVNLDGNYGEWKAIYDNSTWASKKTEYPGVPVTEDDISAGGGSSKSGSSSWSDYYYGPGVVNQGYYYPYNQNYTIGPNGEIIHYQGNQYQYQNGYIVPGSMNQQVYPNNGAYNYQQVPSPYANNNAYQYNNNGQLINPNYNYGNYNNGTYNNGAYNNGAYNNGTYNNGTYNNGANNYSPNTNNSNASPQITQGLEVGWHIDNNGRFYYQGNGAVLRGTWYFIDGSYYRFSDNGYMLANQWFKDSSTGYWYYLGGDGRMLTGWQCINGTWYYFKPENGSGYGTMYSNVTLQISDPKYGSGFYAFDSNGATVMNAWYGGYYYGRDGKRTN